MFYFLKKEITKSKTKKKIRLQCTETLNVFGENAFSEISSSFLRKTSSPSQSWITSPARQCDKANNKAEQTETRIEDPSSVPPNLIDGMSKYFTPSSRQRHHSITSSSSEALVVSTEPTYRHATISFFLPSTSPKSIEGAHSTNKKNSKKVPNSASKSKLTDDFGHRSSLKAEDEKKTRGYLYLNQLINYKNKLISFSCIHLIWLTCIVGTQPEQRKKILITVIKRTNNNIIRKYQRPVRYLSRRS